MPENFLNKMTFKIGLQPSLELHMRTLMRGIFELRGTKSSPERVEKCREEYELKKRRRVLPSSAKGIKDCIAGNRDCSNTIRRTTFSIWYISFQCSQGLDNLLANELKEYLSSLRLILNNVDICRYLSFLNLLLFLFLSSLNSCHFIIHFFMLSVFFYVSSLLTFLSLLFSSFLSFFLLLISFLFSF